MRIKCDESSPICAYCKNKSIECIYPKSTIAASSNIIGSTPGPSNEPDYSITQQNLQSQFPTQMLDYTQPDINYQGYILNDYDISWIPQNQPNRPQQVNKEYYDGYSQAEVLPNKYYGTGQPIDTRQQNSSSEAQNNFYAFEKPPNFDQRSYFNPHK